MVLQSATYGFGEVRLGRLVVRETYNVAESETRMLSISGQSSVADHPGKLERMYYDVLRMKGKLLPVTFSDKAHLNGFYTVVKSDVTWQSYGSRAASQHGAVKILSWSMDLQHLGMEDTLDLESRLAGVQTRANDFATSVGEVWHSPPIGHFGYDPNAVSPSVLTRVGEDGSHKVYRGLLPNTPTRWGSTPQNYIAGRVQFLDSTGWEHSGDEVELDPTGWILTNGLVRVQPLASGGVLSIEAYTGGSWKAKAWDVLFNGSTIGPIDSVDILQNEMDTITLRCFKSVAPLGRLTIDLCLRRGSRFVEVYYQSNASATLALALSTNTAGTQTLGYMTASANDADGNRYVIGSSKTFTPNLNGGLGKSSAVALGAFIGVAAGGSGAVGGDTAADLYKQYLGVQSEYVRGVRR